MKRIISSWTFFLTFFCLMMTGCQKDEENAIANNNGIQYNTIITVKGNAGAKTSYENGTVKWCAGDKISVVRGSTNTINRFSDFTIHTGVGSSEATFTGNIPESAKGLYYAIYPNQSSSDLSINDDLKMHCVVIQPRQTLTNGSFGNGNNTSVGYNVSTTMAFRNVGGLAKILVNGIGIISSVRITNTANTNNKLSGKGCIDLNTLAITWDNDNSYNYVEAKAADTINGHDISGGQLFYIALPPCTMSTYSITITDIYGNEYKKNFSTPVTISRSTVTNLGTFSVLACPKPAGNEVIYITDDGSKYEPTWTLWGNATIQSNVYYGTYGVITFDTVLLRPHTSGISGNDHLLKVVLPESVNSLDDSYIYFNCANLREVNIPSGVSNLITWGVISGCPNIRVVKCARSEAPTLNPPYGGNYIFEGLPEDVVLHVPYGSIPSYGNKGWRTYFTHIADDL